MRTISGLMPGYAILLDEDDLNLQGKEWFDRHDMSQPSPLAPVFDMSYLAKSVRPLLSCTLAFLALEIDKYLVVKNRYGSGNPILSYEEMRLMIIDHIGGPLEIAPLEMTNGAEDIED